MYDLSSFPRNNIFYLILFALGYVLSIANILYGLAYYIIPLILWATTGIVYVSSRQFHSLGKEDVNLVLLMVLVSLVPWYFVGVLFGFGVNIFAVFLHQYIIYIMYKISYVFSIEVLRNILVKKINYVFTSLFKLVLISIMITLVMFPYSKITSFELSDLPELLVLFTQNILLTAIAWRYGFKIQVILGLSNIFITKLSPIIPDVTGVTRWLVLALISLLQTTIFIHNSSNGLTAIKRNVRRINTILSKRNNIKKIVDAINTIMLVIVLGFLASFFLGFRAVVVVSNSMQPLLSRGDLVFINIFDQDIRENDIVLFVVENKMIIHRVISTYTKDNEVNYLTKGDANQDPDPWVLSRENIIGKYVFSIPYIGYPSLYFSAIFSSPVTGIGTTITFILGLFIIYMLREVVHNN